MIKLFKDVKFNFINVLTLLLVLLCFVFFFWICSDRASEDNHNIGEVKTALINVLLLVIGYHFGSSRSSAKKDDTIHTMSENQTEGK